MSPACYRHFSLLAEMQPPRNLDDQIATQAARLVFAAIMAAPDLPAERKQCRDL